jgi:tetratricopeptide (TPR) repeat protein
MILQAAIQAGDDDEAATSALQAAVAQTSSRRLKDAIGSQAQTMASRLIWAGPGRTAVPSATGLNAAKIATETLTDSMENWNSYAAALHVSRCFPEALTAYDKAISLNPDSAVIHRNRGNVLRSLGRFPEARAAYDKAIRLNPQYADAYSGMGDTLRDLGLLPEARAAFDKAITLNPQNADAYSSMGRTLCDLGCFPEALTAFDKAITLNPQNADAHSGRGWTLHHLGRFRESRAAYDKARTIDPEGAPPKIIGELVFYWLRAVWMWRHRPPSTKR